ncbi:MAG: hypothetical protein CMK59_04280 [Proteobacteria bacterium]|nr:hypothetical protein [Pseudomonadota bacterium]
MLLFILACGPLKKLTESPQERLIRLRTEYRNEMLLIYEQSGLGVSSSSEDSSLMNLAKGVFNSVGQEALEQECLNIGRGYDQVLGLDYFKNPEIVERCMKQALKVTQICELQKELGQQVDSFCI